MTTLTQHLCETGHTEQQQREVMNALSDAGLVSDNAVTANDVAEVDCKRAVGFLRGGVDSPSPVSAKADPGWNPVRKAIE